MVDPVKNIGWIIIKILPEVANIWIFPPICLKWHAAEKNQATYSKKN